MLAGREVISFGDPGRAAVEDSQADPVDFPGAGAASAEEEQAAVGDLEITDLAEKLQAHNGVSARLVPCTSDDFKCRLRLRDKKMARYLGVDLG